MTTQIDFLNSEIAAATAQQASNTANAAKQNTQLGLQITAWQEQIATLETAATPAPTPAPAPSPTPTGN